MKSIYRIAAALVLGAVSISPSIAQMGMSHTSSPFQGPKANTGTVSHSMENGRSVLTLSDDFVAPGTPDPHWAVVDSKGTMYVLDRLTLKPQGMAMEDHGKQPDRFQKKITVPDYVKDVKKVVIWCAWAETNLGEASFSSAVK
ncbi:MAG TPA: hypothetical protein VFA60_15810 [Terriglobales bacterium]|nr:hypothetical protein [Terriglobales bacterium]